MKLKSWYSFHPRRELLTDLILIVLCIVINFSADLFSGTVLFYVLYQGVLVLGLCIGVPLWLTAVRRKESLSFIGITGARWAKAVLIGLILAAASIGGRVINMHPVLTHVDMFLYVSAGMLMSTLFEEVFFRGFLQTSFEKSFGIIPAVILSGACFALYHLGYSFIRSNPVQLLSLFGIGIFFSISFRITGSIITSYIVNLPHAILTFMVDPAYGTYLPRFTSASALISLVATAGGLAIILFMTSRSALVSKNSQNVDRADMF